MCNYYYAFRPQCGHHKEITQLCQTAQTLYQECGPHHKRRNWSADYVATSDGCEQCTGTQQRSRPEPHGERRQRHHFSHNTLPQPIPHPRRRSRNANNNVNVVPTPLAQNNPRNPISSLTRRLNTTALQVPPVIHNSIATNPPHNAIESTNHSTREYIHERRTALRAEREALTAAMDRQIAEREQAREWTHARDEPSSDEEDFGVSNHVSSFGRGRQQTRNFESEMQSLERGLGTCMICRPSLSPSPPQVYLYLEPEPHNNTHSHTRRRRRIRSRIFDHTHRSRHDEEEDMQFINGEIFTQQRIRYESPGGTVHTRYTSPGGTEHARRRRRRESWVSEWM